MDFLKSSITCTFLSPKACGKSPRSTYVLLCNLNKRDVFLIKYIYFLTNPHLYIPRGRLFRSPNGLYLL
jgi:hypothetical protein